MRTNYHYALNDGVDDQPEITPSYRSEEEQAAFYRQEAARLQLLAASFTFSDLRNEIEAIARLYERLGRGTPNGDRDSAADLPVNPRRTPQAGSGKGRRF